MARLRLAGSVPAVAALLGVLLLAGPAGAREDDVDFALALADRGYDDLALAEVDRMPKGEKADYTRCQLTRRSALIAASNDKVPPQEVRAKFDASRKAFDTFLRTYPGSRLRAEAEFAMANLMKDFAYYLTKNLEKFEAKDRPGVQEEAAKIFDEAIRYLTGIRDREQKEDEGKDPNDESRFAKRNEAWIYLCMAMHDRAMLKPPGDAVRIQQFTQAIEATTLLLEETDGYIWGFHATRWLGLSHWHRGQMQKGWSAEDIRAAQEYFTTTTAAMDVPDIEKDWPTLVELVFTTASDYGQMCNEVGLLEGVNYPKLFHNEVAKLAEKLPSIRSRATGLQLLIEDAKAMASIGLAEAAIAQLNQVSTWAQDDPTRGRAVDFMAKRALNEVLASIPPDSPIQLAPSVLFKAGEGSYREQNFGRAIRAYQRVLVAIEAEPDSEKRRVLSETLAVECWNRIYECYYRQERHLEAYVAADFVVQRFLASGKKEPSAEVASLALSRIYALQQLANRAAKDRKPEILDQVKRAQELYTTRFQAFNDSGSGDNISYTVGVQKLRDGTSAMQGGDAARGTALLNEAIELFKKVEDKDALHGTAQARIGECLVVMGRHEDAIKHLQAFIQKNTADWTSAVIPAAQKQPWGVALFWIANAHNEMKQYAKVVEVLDGFEARFQGATLDNFFPRVRYLRISAMVKGSRGDEAVKECDRLMKDSPDSGYSVLATLAVANDLKVRSDRAHKEGNPKVEMDLKKRSLPYYDFWLARADDVGADQFTFVGSLHFEVESFVRAAELWTKALEIFKKQENEKMVESLTINLAGLLVGQGRYAEALPQFEALFIKTAEVDDLRAAYAAIRRRPGNVAAPVWEKRTKELIDRIGDVLSKDPDGAARAGEAKKVAAGGDTELLVRAYADTPELRRALSRATALSVLGSDAALPPEMKVTAFQLVKRSPELLSNIARCYEELATASPENAIRAVNIYATLIESSADADDPENPAPGNKYSEKWFDWKYHWVKTYLQTGITYKDRGEMWLRTVCEIVRSMTNLGEVTRANKERAGLGKAFEEFRDQADTALRGIGKEGCK